MSSELRFVDAAGVRLCIESAGVGPPVVLLHGFTGDAESMQSAVDPLVASFSTHRVELVGHGRSQAPCDVADYEMSACVQQLGAALDAVKIQRAHLFGYSMGGRVALSFAASHSDRVASLLLVGASAGLRGEDDRRDRRKQDAALADRIVAEGLESFVDHWMSLPLFASQRRLGAAALRRARAQRMRCRPDALALSLRGIGTGSMPPLHDRLESVKAPVLLVVGEEDLKFRAIATDLAQRLPSAQVEVIAAAGHAAHLENPEDVGRCAREFFETHADDNR